MHICGDGLQALQFRRMRITWRAADLALQFAVACSVDRGKRRAGRRQCLRIGDAAGGAENSKELVALTADAAEEAEFLKNHAPGYDGKQEKNSDNHAGNPARLLEYVSKVDQYNCREQINDVSPQCDEIFGPFRTVAHAPSGINESSRNVSLSKYAHARFERGLLDRNRRPRRPRNLC